MTRRVSGCDLQDGRERLDEEALSGQRVQSLHVDQQVAVSHVQAIPQGRLSCRVVENEAVGHRRVDHRQAGTVEAELARAVEQALAVEGDRAWPLGTGG